MSLCWASGSMLSRTALVKSSQDFTLRRLPPSKGESESPATLSGSQGQAPGFAGGS
jgi:hypothetical protein